GRAAAHCWPSDSVHARGAVHVLPRLPDRGPPRARGGEYGAAGPRPQVVWSNGVLASTAVAVGIELLTNWAGEPERPVYLSYDANAGTVTPHIRLKYL